MLVVIYVYVMACALSISICLNYSLLSESHYWYYLALYNILNINWFFSINQITSLILQHIHIYKMWSQIILLLFIAFFLGFFIIYLSIPFLVFACIYYFCNYTIYYVVFCLFFFYLKKNTDLVITRFIFRVLIFPYIFLQILEWIWLL